MAEYVLGVEEVKELQKRFTAKGDDGMRVEGFVGAMSALLKEKMSDGDIRLLFMRIDAQSVGTIWWSDVASHLLMNRTRSVSRREDQKSYTVDCVDFRNKENKSCLHQQPITRILVHPRLPRYYTSGEDGAVKMWDSADLAYEGAIHSSSAWASDMLFVPGAVDVLVVSTVDRVVSIYDATTGETLRVFRGKKTKNIQKEVIYRKQMNTRHAPSGTGGQYNSTLLQHLKKPETVEVTHLSSLHQVPTSLGYYSTSSAEGLLVGTDDGMILLYDVFRDLTKDTAQGSLPCLAVTDVAGDKIPGWETGHTEAITSLKIAPSIDSIITSSTDGTVRLMSLERGCLLRVLAEASTDAKPIYNIAWDNDTRLIASCGADRNVLVWNPFITKPVMTLRGSRSPLVDVIFNEADSQLFSLSSDSTVRVWDIRMWQCFQVLKNKDDEQVTAIAYDPKRSRLLTGSSRVYARQMTKASDFASTYCGHRKPVATCVWNPQTLQLVSCDEETVMVWGSETRALQTTWTVPSGVTCLGFTSNYQRLLTGTARGDVLVWNCTTAQLLKTFVSPRRPGANPSQWEAGPINYSVMEKPCRINLLASVLGNKRVLLYDDSKGSAPFRDLDIRELGGVYSLCAIPPSTLLVGTGQGVGAIFTDQVGRPVMLPALHGPCLWYSLFNGPLHGGVSELVAKAHEEGPNEWVAVDMYVESILHLSRLGGVVIVAKGEGTIGFWSGPLELVEGRGELFRFYATHKRGNAVNAMSLNKAEDRLHTGDVSGYVASYDITHVGSDCDAMGDVVVNETHIVRVEGFRAFAAAVTSMVCLVQPDGSEVLVCGSNEYNLSMFTPAGVLVHQFGYVVQPQKVLPSNSATCLAFHQQYKQTLFLHSADNDNQIYLHELLPLLSSHELFSGCTATELEVFAHTMAAPAHAPPLVSLEHRKEGVLATMLVQEDTRSDSTNNWSRASFSKRANSQQGGASFSRLGTPPDVRFLPERPLCHLLSEDVHEANDLNIKCRPSSTRSLVGLVKPHPCGTPAKIQMKPGEKLPLSVTDPPESVLSLQQSLIAPATNRPSHRKPLSPVSSPVHKMKRWDVHYSYPTALGEKRRLLKSSGRAKYRSARERKRPSTSDGGGFNLSRGLWSPEPPPLDNVQAALEDEGDTWVFWRSDVRAETSRRRRPQLVLNDKWEKRDHADDEALLEAASVDEDEGQREVSDVAEHSSGGEEVLHTPREPVAEIGEDYADTEKKWFEKAQREHPPTKRRNRRYNVSTTPLRALVNLRVAEPVLVVDPRKAQKKQLLQLQGLEVDIPLPPFSKMVASTVMNSFTH